MSIRAGFPGVKAQRPLPQDNPTNAPMPGRTINDKKGAGCCAETDTFRARFLAFDNPPGNVSEPPYLYEPARKRRRGLYAQWRFITEPGPAPASLRVRAARPDAHERTPLKRCAFSMAQAAWLGLATRARRSPLTDKAFSRRLARCAHLSKIFRQCWTI